MYDKERITKIISDIEKYLKDLEELNLYEDLDDKKNYYACSMLLFSILNRLIDLGTEVISAENFEIPITYKDIFTTLARNSVINKETAERLTELIAYRNALSHQYFEIEKKDIKKIMDSVDLISLFIKTIKKRIK